MDIIFVLAVAIFVDKSCSQVLLPSTTCFKDGNGITLECSTNDFNQAIYFLLDTVLQGGCAPNCGPGIEQSGTITTYTFSFNSSTHSGNWTCSYGSSVSTEVVIAENPCLETSTTFEYSSIIESTSTPIFVESITDISWISPTDASQLNTADIFPFSSDFLSNIVTPDSNHASASFEKDNLETIDSANESFFMHITSSVPNSFLSSMSLIQTVDSYKTIIQSSMIETVTISPLTVTIQSDYQSTSSYIGALSLFSETTIGLLTSGVYMTTPEISPSLIYSALDSSFSATTAVCPTNTFTETVSTYMNSTETINAGMTSKEIVSSSMTFTDILSTGMTSIETIREDMTYPDTLSTGMTSIAVVSTGMTSIETIREDITSPDTLSTGMTSTEILITVMTSIETVREYMPSIDTLSIGMTSTEIVGTGMTSIETIRESMSDSDFSGTRTITFEKGDFSTTPLNYISVIDTVQHTVNFVTTSHFDTQSLSVIQNSFLGSLTIKTLIQTSLGQKHEVESDYTERHSSLPTELFSSMTDQISETATHTYNDISTEHILLVTSSINTLNSFTSVMKNSVLTSDSFVKMISRSSNELANSSSSLDTFSPKYVKTTTTIQHGLSESSKDDIFISAVSGTIGAFILVVLIAMVIRRYLMKKHKSKDEKEDELSNQYGWNDDGGINSYNKNYISREYPFSSSIHLPLHSYESPYYPYPNYYKKNWDGL